MTEPTPRFTLSSARRRGSPSSPVAWVAITLGVLLIALVAYRLSRPPARQVIVPPARIPTPAPAATTTPTPTPGLVPAGSGWVDAAIVRPPSPTPTMPAIPAVAPTRAPRNTPTISQCAGYRWSTIQTFTPSAQVKVDIRVDNRCPYDLGPGNLWFEITGWRNGGRVLSVRGHPFETIRRGRSGELAIGLPGSLDWYDRIDVVVLD